jgi:hypothetical protein
MSKYENKTNEELIELLEAKDEEISEFEEHDQSIEELEDENRDLQNVIDDFNSSLSDREEVSELAFNAGYEAKESNQPLLKSWLNFKIRARI